MSVAAVGIGQGYLRALAAAIKVTRERESSESVSMALEAKTLKAFPRRLTED